MYTHVGILAATLADSTGNKIQTKTVLKEHVRKFKDKPFWAQKLRKKAPGARAMFSAEEGGDLRITMSCKTTWPVAVWGCSYSHSGNVIGCYGIS